MGLCETYYGMFRGKEGGSGWMGWGMSVGKWRGGGVRKGWTCLNQLPVSALVRPSLITAVRLLCLCSPFLSLFFSA